MAVHEGDAFAVADGTRYVGKELTRRRKAWADLCRVIAIYGVILIHACGPIFYAFDRVQQTSWLSVNALDAIARVSVPLFVMISGAMLLGEHAPPAGPRQVLSRVSKILLPLLTWSVFYLYRNSLHSGSPVDWLSVLRQPAMYHLWFVYMIAGVYLLLPFLQSIHDRLDRQKAVVLYFFLVWAAITSVPVYLPLPLLGVMQQTSFLGYGGYFILGGLLANSRNLTSGIPTGVLIAIYAGASAATFFLMWMFSVQAGMPSEKAYVYFAPNVAIASLAAFSALARVDLSAGASRILQWVSDRCFLVFFVHVVVLERVRFSGAATILAQTVPQLLSTLIVATATFLFSLAIAAAIRAVPGARRVAG